jgi:hypothetical protein
MKENTAGLKKTATEKRTFLIGKSLTERGKVN